MYTDLNINFYYNIKKCINSYNMLYDMFNISLINDRYIFNYKKIFQKQLNIYNKNITKIENGIYKSHNSWKNLLAKKEASQIFMQVKKDNKYFLNSINKRLENYDKFYYNKENIIKQLYKIYNKKYNDNINYFEYFLNKCKNIDLFDISLKDLYNEKLNNNITNINNKTESLLYQWYNDNIDNILIDLELENNSINIDTIKNVFDYYWQYRIYTYKIFNSITINIIYNTNSNKKIIRKFINNIISNKLLIKLLNYANKLDNTYEKELFDFNKLLFKKEKNELNEKNFYSLFFGEKDKKLIKSIELANKDVNACKILSDGKSVFANANFYPGDIIEICPAKLINNDALYSKDMRDIVFEVEQYKKYVIPFGYCQYYDISNDPNIYNCEYQWIPEKNIINIIANKKIKKLEKLYLNN